MPITHSTGVLLPGRTGDISNLIVGIDEEFQEFCPRAAPGQLNQLKQIVIGLGVVGSLVGREPINTVYLTPLG